MQVLIVEDSRVTRHLLAQLCREMGHTCTVVGDGEAALTLAATHGCILMDLHLPGVDGWDTAERILAQHPGAYIIAVTSNYSPAVQAYSYQMGMAEFLAKPVDRETLRGALERAARKLEGD